MEHELNLKLQKLVSDLAEATLLVGERDNEIRRLQDTISQRDAEWMELRDKYQSMLTELSTAGAKQIGDLNDKIYILTNALIDIHEESNEGNVCEIAKQALTQNKLTMNTVTSIKESAIIIITYNSSRFIKKQVECIKKFCKEEVDIIIVDNSTDPEVVNAIKYYNDSELHCEYLKTDASSKNGSDSHSYAANLSYLKFKDEYNFIMYLDHDCFPVKPFSIKEMLGNGSKIITGVGQRKGDIEYFWPGLVMWDNSQIDKSLINFNTNHDLELDTGGMLFHTILRYGKDMCPFLDEKHVQNPHFNKSMYNFYAMMAGDTFMHFINGSSWNPADGHDERINSLMNILEGKLNGK